MATYARSVRRGLPRASGGDPWPPAGAAPAPVAVAPTPVDPPATADPPVPGTPPVSVEPTETAPTGTASMQNASARGAATRRGLPRTPGGEAWPPAASTAADAATPAVPAVENAPREAHGHGADPVLVDAAEPAASTPAASTVAASTVAASADDAGSGAVRRGLPRAGGVVDLQVGGDDEDLDGAAADALVGAQHSGCLREPRARPTPPEVRLQADPHRDLRHQQDPVLSYSPMTATFDAEAEDGSNR